MKFPMQVCIQLTAMVEVELEEREGQLLTSTLTQPVMHAPCFLIVPPGLMPTEAQRNFLKSVATASLLGWAKEEVKSRMNHEAAEVPTMNKPEGPPS